MDKPAQPEATPPPAPGLPTFSGVFELGDGRQVVVTFPMGVSAENMLHLILNLTKFYTEMAQAEGTAQAAQPAIQVARSMPQRRI